MPTKDELEAQVEQLTKQLADEQAAHNSTKADHSNAFEELKAASSANLSLRQQLADEQAAHAETRSILEKAGAMVEQSAGPASPAKDRGSLYVNTEGEEKYFTDETVKVAGAQNMEGWKLAGKKPEPLKH